MEKMYNMVDLAKLLNVKVRTTRTWAREGKIRAERIPGTKAWIIPESEVKRLLNIKDTEGNE